MHPLGLKLNPTILFIEPKTLIGISMTMSLQDDTTAALWRSFMLQKKAIPSLADCDYYSLQIYPADYFVSFEAGRTFEKYALIEKQEGSVYPANWTDFNLLGGIYAIFQHRSPDTRIFEEIYTQWLPQSGYVLDNRPHFEKMPSGYIPGHPDSEEDIYIPIRAV